MEFKTVQSRDYCIDRASEAQIYIQRRGGGGSRHKAALLMSKSGGLLRKPGPLCGCWLVGGCGL